MADASYSGPAPTSPVPTAGGEPGSAYSTVRRRRLPPQAEQERRKAWGRVWGPKVAEAVRKAIREAE